ncbi:hypothetical protein [Kutzneria sp. NPDC052558]|uniref:hypothetical protein n=1 Tax=Kutzneria sp. NPDC052558 TaxID=3364121 RepID=UPI0037CB659B
MSANLDMPVDTEWWRLSDGALGEVGVLIEERRKTDYLREIAVVRERWNRSSRTKDDRNALLAYLTVTWKITRGEARDLVRFAELFERNAVRDVAVEETLSKQHLNIIDTTLSAAPEADRDDVEAALVDNAPQFDTVKFHDLA